jgi:hypothetical protein
VSNCYYQLNIDILDAINKNFKFEEPEYITKTKHGVWGFDGENLIEFFNKEWLEYMKSISLEVIAVMIFYRLPQANTNEAHTDLMYGQENYPGIAINWTVGDDDGIMAWYNTPVNAVDVPIKIILPEPGHKYFSWNISELTEIDRHIIGNVPTAVRVDIPHTIIMGDKARWAISIRCKPKTNIFKWDDIIEYIKPYIKDNSTQLMDEKILGVNIK